MGRQRGEAPGRRVFDQENRLHQRLHVLVHPSGVDVPSSALRFLTQQLRRRIGGLPLRHRSRPHP
ncbi:hypothetical protein DI273_00200 [Streptomyces violascens]|nr:hypothetical protein DI273_00200 [Streptomyces violascens]